MSQPTASPNQNDADILPAKVLFVVNEPTPYRLHLLGRFVNEIPEITAQTIFTHPIKKLSVPWQIDLNEELAVVKMPIQQADSERHGRMRAWRLGGEILDFAHNQGVQFIYLHGYNEPTRIRIICGAEKRNIKVFVRGDSNYFDERAKPIYKRVCKELVLKRLLAKATGTMAMGTAGRAYFSTYAPPDKPMFMVPVEPDYGAIRNIDPTERNAFLEEFGLKPDRKRMMYCGRMVKIKRVDLLLRAFFRIAEQRKDWDLVLAGSGQDVEQLRAMVPPQLKDRVIWLGFMQFDQIRNCYASCDMLVHPSIYEPWGLVINEAVAAGMAVIATNVTGAAIDLVRHGTNGMLVPPDDEDALAAAMLKASEQQTLQELKANAPMALQQWQRAADPVDGMRQALQWSGII